MSFRITGLSPAPFAPLFDLDDAALAEQGARRYVADAPRGFPCRISLADAAPGEEVLLVNHEHQPAATPYRSRHAIFVRRDAEPFDGIDTLPPAFAGRTLSLRAFDTAHMMVDAALVGGEAAAESIAHLLARREVDYIHAHFAARGCFIACVVRA